MPEALHRQSKIKSLRPTTSIWDLREISDQSRRSRVNCDGPGLISTNYSLISPCYLRADAAAADPAKGWCLCEEAPSSPRRDRLSARAMACGIGGRARGARHGAVCYLRCQRRVGFFGEVAAGGPRGPMHEAVL